MLTSRWIQWLPVVNVLQCTRCLISQSIKTKEAPHHSPRLQHPQEKGATPWGHGMLSPLPRGIWCSLQQGLRNMAVSTCVFDDAVGIYFMYMFTVTICRRTNQNHSSLLTFSKTSYRKESLNLSYIHLTSYLQCFCPFRDWGVLLLAGTDQITSFSQISFSHSPLYHLFIWLVFSRVSQMNKIKCI